MSTTHTRYQEGSIDRIPRAKGPDVWVYRWREVINGQRVQRKRTIGNLKKYPTKSSAKKAVENLRSEINAQQEKLGKMTVEEFLSHFKPMNCETPTSTVPLSPLIVTSLT